MFIVYNFINFLLGNYVLSAPFNIPLPSSSSPPNLCSSGDFWACFDKIFLVILKIVMMLAIVLSTISVSLAGVLYIVKGSSKEEIAKIHQRLIWSIVGLVIALVSFAIVVILERTIIKLSLDFWLPNLVFAQLSQPIVPQPIVPFQLKCGGADELPSIFSSDSARGDIWRRCLWFYSGQILSLLYRLALALAVIFLSWAGVLYITQPEKTKEIHGRLIWGVIGALIAILSFTLVKLIEAFFLKVVALIT